MEKRKHIWAMLLFVVSCLFSTNAFAYDAEIDGIYYNFNENEATVTYNDYDYYSGDILIPKSVIYNEKTYSVTSIGDKAFFECYDLTSVNIPNSVTYIGYHAFWACSNLTSITIPNSVTYIGTEAFSCSSLTSVTIPNSVTEINYDAFSNCRALTSVTIPNSVTIIRSNAFSGCDGLTSVIIPNSVTRIGSDAFLDCYFTKESFINNSTLTSDTYWGATICDIETNDGLLITNNEVVKCRPCATSVVIPNSVTSIGKNAFYCCYGLTSVTIPNSVTSIGDNAFGNCSGLKKVIVPDIAAWCGIAFADPSSSYSYSNPLRYAKHLYSDEATEITNLIIPNSVTSIGSSAFYNCSGLTSVTIPNSVTSIGSSAFLGCSGLTSVTINSNAVASKSYTIANNLSSVFGSQVKEYIFGEGVQQIGNCALYCCSGLTSVTIHNSVTSIGERAFYDCDGLTSVTIPNSVTNIGRAAFYGCDGLTSVTIPNSVTSIGDQAFDYCSGLTSVTINSNAVASKSYDSGHTIASIFGSKVKEYIFGEDVQQIGNWALYRCSSLTSVTIPNSVTSIGSGAFCECDGLTSVTIPNSVTSIGEWAFERCSGLKKVIVPDIAAWCSIEFGNEYANPLLYAKHLYSDETTEITNLIIPDSVKSIGNYAFRHCDGLTSVTIPNSVTSIGNDAFFCCYGLATVTIGNSVTSIGSGAFRYCDALTSVTIGNSVTSIGDNAFYGCSGLKKVIVPDIAAWCDIAFGNLYAHPLSWKGGGNLYSDETTQITNLIIPNSVTSIGNWAFYRCEGLTSVTIGNSVTSIGSQAFDYCSGLKKVIVPDIAAWCSIEFGNEYANPLLYAKHLYSDETTEITNLIIPSSVTSIGDYAFRNCRALTSVNIPNSVTSIGDYAFYYCSGLTSITIGNSVKSIENYAFAYCSKLTDVYCYAESVPSTGSDAFTESNIQNATLHVPGSKAAYEAVSPWNGFGEIVEMTSPITVGETGFATFCSPYALDFSEVEDIRAYIVSGFNQETGTLVLTRVTEVPAGEGLYIAGTPGEHRIPKTQTSMFYANLLKGVTEPTIISPTDGNYTNYILSNGSYGVGFYTLSQTGTLDAGKAYLQLLTASVAGIKALKIEFDENDDPTGIAITSTSPTEENTIYNLAGQRVSKAHRGINIVNGKKVFIK